MAPFSFSLRATARDLLDPHQRRLRPDAAARHRRDARDQRRLGAHAMVLAAVHAAGDRLTGPADAAGLEVREALDQLALELLMPRDRRPGLVELLQEQG